jgi:TPR repeat protein
VPIGLALAVALPVLSASGVASLAQEVRGFAQVTPSDDHAYSNGNYYALVIGIDDYPSPLHPLKTAVNDAKAVGNLLQERYGFQVQYLLDKDATRFNILDALSKLRKTLSENDNLLIYYGGHGYYDHDADKAYWLPADADSGTSPNTIMADDLTSAVRVLPSRHVLIISDSCYSGGLDRDADAPVSSGGEPAFLNRMMISRSRTLMASGGNEPVSDSGTDGHSVFAYAVLQALEQDQAPIFTASDLFYTSIRQPVAGKSTQLPQYSILRNSNHDQGDFVFVRKSSFNPLATTPAPAPGRAPGPTLSAANLFAKGHDLAEAGDFKDAVTFLTDSCNGGYGEACTYFGWVLENGKGVEKNPEKALVLYRKGCDAGNAGGCFNLGLDYDDGHGVGNDLSQAAAFYRKACDGDFAEGCTNLGYMYDHSIGMKKDEGEAFKLYSKGCDGGNPSGCTDLGVLYFLGDGVEKDEAKALSLFRKGCEGDDETACDDVGIIYREGKAVAKDESQAVGFFRKACDGGSAKGCDNLGASYEDGEGLARDIQLAAKFYRRACDGGFEDGCANLKRLQP